jgi:extracellular elastinolytic metalloproteinase
VVTSPVQAFLIVTDHVKLPIDNRDTLKASVLDQKPRKKRRRARRKAFTIVNAPPPILSTRIRQAYYRMHKQKVAHVWHVQFETKDHYITAYVDKKTAQVIAINDAVSDAGGDTLDKTTVDTTPTKVEQKTAFPRRTSYRVFPVGLNDPRDGPRRLVQEPIDRVASPRGWRVKEVQAVTVYDDTQGVNAHVQDSPLGNKEDDWITAYRPKVTKSTFDFPLGKDTADKSSLDAAITNVYYWMNMMHDITYAYGFNEEAGNFQDDNYGRGGVDKDGVYALVRNKDGMNNANFLTLADGTRGRLRLYLFKGADTTIRDSAFDNGVLIHEYSHGVSNRLTGGPKNYECLVYDEPGGLGEGTGDIFSLLLRSTAQDKRDGVYGFASYLTASPNGLRTYPYTTDMSTSPETYGWLEKPGYFDVHVRGSIWALALWEVYWNLRNVLPFTEDWKSASTKHANTLMLQLIVDGLKLQPCRPRYTDARDAILQAERLLTDKYACVLWKGFAKRGLGVDAHLVVEDGMESGYKESMDIPATCK